MQNAGTKPWCNGSCCREQLSSLAGVLQPSDQTSLPKVREYFVEAFFKAFTPWFCLLGYSITVLKGTGCKCSQSPPQVDSLLPSGGESLSQAVALYKSAQFHTECCSLCLCSKPAGCKQTQIWRHNRKKNFTKSTFPLDRNLFMSPEKSRGRS